MSKKLVVLDLDGVLFTRNINNNINNNINYDFKIKNTYYILNDGASDFINYCLDNYEVGIFTSITPSNTKIIISKIFTYGRKNKLKFIYDRSHTKLDPDYEKLDNIKKFDTVKYLTDVINNPIINTNRTYNLDNTIIIDDTYMKVRFNPVNSICIYNNNNNNNDTIDIKTFSSYNDIINHLSTI